MLFRVLVEKHLFFAAKKQKKQKTQTDTKK